MWTTAQIRRHIQRLPRGSLFTTRDMLGYGSRASVDQTMYRLVKRGEILRLARGVFMVEAPDARLPSPVEVAMVKARSFARTILTHGRDIAQSLGIIADGNAEPTFTIDGRSSSFRYQDQVILLKGASPRKMLDDGKAARAVRALWHIGRHRCDQRSVMLATASFGRNDRKELQALASLMPAWMNDQMSWAR